MFKKKKPKPVEEGPPYSSNAVARMTGASLRQLQWWDEQGVFAPVHNGHAREWSETQLHEVKLCMDLRNGGLSLQKVRSAIAMYRKLKPTFPADRFFVLVPHLALGLPNYRRGNVQIATSEEEAVCLLAAAKRPMILSVVENAG